MERIKVSSNKHFLVTGDDQPFFWLADTAWELFHRCTLDDIALYLDNRRNKGFNVVQSVILAELDGLRVPNAIGEVPLIDMDINKPNPAYFDFIEHVIQMVAERDMYMCVLPTWGDKVTNSGKGPQIFNESNARAYGQFLGKRYRKHDNLIWMNGGDRYAVDETNDYRPIWRALGEGIKSEADQIMTFHPRGVDGSSTEFHHDSWLDFNTWQSTHNDINEPIWEEIFGDWMRMPTKPVLDSEPCYEGIHIQFDPANGYFTPYDIRRRVYRGVFAGGCGFTYGHSSIWQMKSDEHESVLASSRPWKDCLDDPAAFQVHHLKDLMLSREPYLNRIPDQSLLLSNYADNHRHVRATREGNGLYVMVYIPTRLQSVQLNLRRLSGETFKASWFDPRTGKITEIGIYGRQDHPTFTTQHKGPDWVLLIDSQDN